MSRKLRRLERKIVAEIDAFATQLLEEAKAFLEKSRTRSDVGSKKRISMLR